MENKPQNKKDKAKEKSKDRLMYAVLACMVVIIIILVILLLHSCPGSDGMVITDYDRDPNAALGEIDEMDEDELQNALNEYVQEGMFNISINPSPIFENGAAAGNLRIENIAANRYLMSVQITLDNTGEVIYQSGVIEPNHHIEYDTLDVVLEKGNYNATATFTAYEPDTQSVRGHAAAKILIVVQN